MLVLTRKKGQSIRIGDDIFIEVIDIKGEGVKIGITAPDNLSILRKELIEEISSENQTATIFNQQALANLTNILKKI